MNCKSSDAALFVARCLKGTRTLAKIDLKSNTLGQLGAQTLEMALKQNQSLTHLNIRNTGVNLAALKHIVGPLHVSNLLTVDLSYNSIGPEGCKLMSSALAKCSITALNLSNCYLTSRGERLCSTPSTSLPHASVLRSNGHVWCQGHCRCASGQPEHSSP